MTGRPGTTTARARGWSAWSATASYRRWRITWRHTGSGIAIRKRSSRSRLTSDAEPPGRPSGRSRRRRETARLPGQPADGVRVRAVRSSDQGRYRPLVEAPRGVARVAWGLTTTPDCVEHIRQLASLHLFCSPFNKSTKNPMFSRASASRGFGGRQLSLGRRCPVSRATVYRLTGSRTGVRVGDGQYGVRMPIRNVRAPLRFAGDGAAPAATSTVTVSISSPPTSRAYRP